MAPRITATTIPAMIAANIKRSPSRNLLDWFLLFKKAITIPANTIIPTSKKTNTHSLNCWLRIPSMLRSSFGEISELNCEIWRREKNESEMKIFNSCFYWDTNSVDTPAVRRGSFCFHPIGVLFQKGICTLLLQVDHKFRGFCLFVKLNLQPLTK